MNQSSLKSTACRGRNFILQTYKIEIEVCPVYDPYVGEWLLEKTLVLGHRLCEVGWPVTFLAAFISPMFPPGPHSLLGGQ